MGYRIPKDATIIANIRFVVLRIVPYKSSVAEGILCRAMAHDPDVYPQPELFDPERYSEKAGQPPQLDPRKFVFGFGRRVCPGTSDKSCCTLTTNVLRLDIGRCATSRGFHLCQHDWYPCRVRHCEGVG